MHNLGNADFIHAFVVIQNLKEHPGFLVRLFFCVDVGHTQAQTELDDFQKTRGQRAAQVTSQVQFQGATVTFRPAHYQGSCGVEKTQVVTCRLGCSKKSSRVEVSTAASTLGLLVITFRVTSMRMFVEEGISDMETYLSGVERLFQRIAIYHSNLMGPGFPALVSKILPSCVCDYLYYVGFRLDEVQYAQ